jgi:hypothetical protein
MTIVAIVLGAFALIETANVFFLYKMPATTMGNGVGVFRAYARSQEDPEIRAFVNYLINWVAGTKLIFIVLIVGIIITGPPETKLFSAIALVFSIATFYLRLYPILKAMDAKGELQPAGYSRTLAWMIAGFIAAFVVAIGVHLVR